MPRLDPKTLLDFARRLLQAMGADDEAAAKVAEHLVSSNLAGHDSHGVLRLVQYREHVREGKIAPRARPETLRESAATALIDGKLAWGQVVAHDAIRIAMRKAEAAGAAAIAVRNAYHIGRVGAYALLAAEAGFVAQILCNGHGVARVAPWGGREPRLATNPIAIAVPSARRPILVDITTSVVAEGKVRVARNAGKAIPEGWVLDSRGEPTTNPNALYCGGSLLPLGGREGYKGYGLSVVVDLLGGVLSGAGCGLLTSSVGNGIVFQLLNPAAFADPADFRARVEEYVVYLKSTPCKPGVSEVLLPGEPEERIAEERRRVGIEIDDGSWAGIESLARELVVAMP